MERTPRRRDGDSPDGPGRPAGVSAVVVAVAATLLVGLPAPAAGQGLLEWTLRASPEPEPLLTGGVAGLWNPAGIAGAPADPNEAWVANLDGPDVTGVEGIAVAVTRALPPLGSVGIAYQHVGTGGIPRTLDSPRSEPGEISLDEDLMALSYARAFDDGRLAVGAGVRYRRSGRGDDVLESAGVDVGARKALPDLPFSPAVAAVIREVGSGAGWMAAGEVGLPVAVNHGAGFRVSYGVTGSFGEEGWGHRVAGIVAWRGTVRAGFGLARGARDGDWTPLWMLGVELGPYSLSILRESLANDFGAAESYRLAIRLP